MWVADSSPAGVSEFNPLGRAGASSPFFSPQGGFAIAIDTSGNVWVSGTSELIELNSAGAVIFTTTAGGLNSPGSIAIDQSGDVWVQNGAGPIASEFTSTGVAISPSTGYLPGYGGSGGLAIDGDGSVWVANAYFACGLCQLDQQGNLLQVIGDSFGPQQVAIDFNNGSHSPWVANSLSATASKYCGFCKPPQTLMFGTCGTSRAIAIDGGGIQAWVASFSPGGLVGINSITNAGLGFCSYTTGGLGSAGYDDIAIDPSGNIWIASLDSNSMTEFVGLARPTRTPLIGPPVMP